MADKNGDVNNTERCKCDLEYVSVACNRTPLCLDWGRNGWVAFGACYSVALCRNPKRVNAFGKIEYILNGHKDRVNCVKWITQPSFGNEIELISGSTDKSVIVWQKISDPDCNIHWRASDVLEGHQGAVNSVAGINIPSSNKEEQRTVITSASADSTVRIWERKGAEDHFICLQTVSFGKGFILALALSILPRTTVPVIACGGEDNRLHLFVEKDNNLKQFVRVQSLLGHEDWIRDVEFATEDSGNLLLTSCAQDAFIRIWRISCVSKIESEMELLEHDGLQELKLTSNVFHATDRGSEKEFAVVLESVLTGHEGWIYGIDWQPAVRRDDGTFSQPMALLSASMDKTLMLWSPDEDSGVWVEKVRVGEVGGTTLGFYGGVFSPDGLSILGHGYQGSFHLWNKTLCEGDSRWEPGVAVSGHFGPVQDIDWDPVDGQFLVSASSDQTTRLHAPWRQETSKSVWCEIARPQVHGYDMQCLSMLSRYRLASGADEKVLRVFSAPRQFMETFRALCDVQDTNDKLHESLPVGASVPALGLSNKAVFEGDIESLRRDLEDPARPMKASAFASEEPAPFTPVSLNEPPTEDILLQNTLWPEVQKLYGHGYEVFCVASSPDGTLLASACKASKAEHAAIILWNTETWRQVCSLASHTLTVTQMSFDHSGQRLLSVSRDRCWSVFKRKYECEEGSLFRLVARSNKTNQHARIIWSCAWTGDDKFFATASRDKKVIIWGDRDPPTDTWEAVGSPLDVGEPTTAVDVAPGTINASTYLVAVGTESGRIVLYSWGLRPSPEWNILLSLDQSISHVLTVRRLRWRPMKDRSKSSCLQLGSCSLDHSVRIYDVFITT
ncbi:elongator complex protein 2-like isoform X1 [Montipora foliosa]|uniref:elongator complex protein 2-like isoform X1 n=1 Tax=Montipora foliosa TaxID=591990 RepID=UPI0035F15F55